MRSLHPIARARPLTRLSALLVVVLAAALAGPFMSTAGASASASCNRTQFPTTCEVIEPNVKQFSTTYPQIQLYARQHVTIQAGGCVQTGGRGKTWKRYVNPVGGFGLYKGYIDIPYTTFGPLPLWQVLNAEFTVTRDTPLILDYDDDNYGDNGYWGRAGDDGTGDQCRGLGNAWVRLTITN